MKNQVRSAFAILLLLLTIQPARASVDVGDKPTIRLQTVDGKAIDNAALRGRIIVVDFWATWCGPCMAEADHMVRLYKEFNAKGVNFVGISLDNNVPKMTSVAEDKGFSWPQVCDQLVWKSPLVKQWGVNGIPKTFILSPAGEVVWSGHPGGLDKPLAEALKKYPPVLSRKDQIERAVVQVKEAGKTFEDGADYAKALALLGDVPDSLLREPDVFNEAKAIVAKFKTDADAPDRTTILAALREDKDGARAVDTLRRAIATARPAAGSNAKATTQPARDAQGANDASSKATAGNRELLAQSRLAAAEKLRDGGDHVAAYRTYRQIKERYANTPASTAASERVSAYEADEKFMAEFKKAEAEQEAVTLLATASSYKKAGKSDLATQAYQKIADFYPDTAAAKEAREELEKQ